MTFSPILLEECFLELNTHALEEHFFRDLVMPSCQTLIQEVSTGGSTFTQAYSANYQQNYLSVLSVSVHTHNLN
jgi:hypothetical protein